MKKCTVFVQKWVKFPYEIKQLMNSYDNVDWSALIRERLAAIDLGSDEFRGDKFRFKGDIAGRCGRELSRTCFNIFPESKVFMEMNGRIDWQAVFQDTIVEKLKSFGETIDLSGSEALATVPDGLFNKNTLVEGD